MKKPLWMRLIPSVCAAAITALVLVAGCGSSTQSPQSASQSNDAVHSSVQSVEVDGHLRRYVCFTYTTVDRGGIWCERVSVEP